MASSKTNHCRPVVLRSPSFVIGLMIVVLFALGIYSLLRVHAMNEIVLKMDAAYTGAATSLNNVAANSERLRNLQSLTLLTKDAVQRDGVRKRIGLVEQRRKAAWNEHAQAASPMQKDMLRNVDAAWRDYMQLSEKALAKRESGDEVSAVADFNNEVQHAMDRYRGAFKAYLDYQNQSVHMMSASSEALREEVEGVIIFVFLFAFPMTLWAGYAMSRFWT